MKKQIFTNEEKINDIEFVTFILFYFVKKKIKEKKKESNNKEYKYQADNVYLTPFRIWKSVQAQGSNTIQQY